LFYQRQVDRLAQRDTRLRRRMREADKKGRHRNLEILIGAGEIYKNLGIYQGTADQQL